MHFSTFLKSFQLPKFTKVSGENPDMLEFGRVKLRLKFCPKLFHIKTFDE